MLGDGEVVLGLHVVRDGVVVSTIHRHVAEPVLEVQGRGADVQGDETVGSLLLVGTKELDVGAQRNTVVAVTGLGVTSATGQDEVSVLVLVVGQAVVVAVDDNTVVLLDDVHQGSQLGVVGRGGNVTVVELEDLPGGGGLRESLLQERDLLAGFLVAVDEVVGIVDRGVGLVFVDEAVRFHHDEGRAPVRAGQVVGVVGHVAGAEVPAVIDHGSNLRLEVDTGLTRDNIVVAKGHVPGLVVEGRTSVQVGPALVEAADTLGSEVNTAVVEVVADGHVSGAVLLRRGADFTNVASSTSCWKRSARELCPSVAPLHPRSRLTLLDGGIVDVLAVTRVAVVQDITGDVHALGLQLRQDVVAELQGHWLPASPAEVTEDANGENIGTGGCRDRVAGGRSAQGQAKSEGRGNARHGGHVGNRKG